MSMNQSVQLEAMKMGLVVPDNFQLILPQKVVQLNVNLYFTSRFENINY